MIDTLNSIAGHLNYFFEILFLLDLQVRLFVKKDSVLRRFHELSVVGIAAVLGVITYLADQNFSFPFPGVMWLYLAEGILFGLLAARDYPLKNGILVVIYIIMLMLVRYLISGFLLLKLVKTTDVFGNGNLVVGIVCLAVIFCFTRLVLKVTGGGGKADFPPRYGILLLALIVLVFAILIQIQDTITSIDADAPILLTLYGMMFAIYFLFVYINNDMEERIRQSLLVRELELNSRHVKETEQLYENLRKLRHELKNQELYVKTLVKDKEYEKLEEYFDERTQQEEKLTDTGNITVNAILNAKLKEAAARNIRTEVKACLPASLKIESGDLFSLIANIWDNAMEHSDAEQPEIKAKFTVVKAYLSIVVSNRVNTDVLAENPKLLTSKTDAANHGIGVKVIRQITEKYDGILDFSVKDGWFTVSVLLKVV